MVPYKIVIRHRQYQMSHEHHDHLYIYALDPIDVEREIIARYKDYFQYFVENVAEVKS
jgi:hypothetical protein